MFKEELNEYASGGGKWRLPLPEDHFCCHDCIHASSFLPPERSPRNDLTGVSGDEWHVIYAYCVLTKKVVRRDTRVCTCEELLADSSSNFYNPAHFRYKMRRDRQKRLLRVMSLKCSDCEKYNISAPPPGEWRQKGE